MKHTGEGSKLKTIGLLNRLYEYIARICVSGDGWDENSCRIYKGILISREYLIFCSQINSDCFSLVHMCGK